MRCGRPGATRPGAANLTLLFLRNDHLQLQKRGVQPTAAAAGAAAGGRKRSPQAESAPTGAEGEEERERLRQRWVAGLRRSTRDSSGRATPSEPYDQEAATADFTVLAVGLHFFRPDGAPMFDL